MSDDSYKEIRKRVERLYNARKDIFIHTAVFVIINVMMWFAWAFTDLKIHFSMMWPLLVSGGWGAGYIGHLIDYLMKEASEKAVQREIERERAWRAGTLDEKPKREEFARLSADGELEIVRYDDDDDDDDEREYRRQRRA